MPLSPIWLESVVRPKSPKQREPRRHLGNWDEVHQKAFETVKATIAKDVVLAYPDYNKVFEVYTDASSTQLGLVITQSNRPLAFFSSDVSSKIAIA